MSLVMINIAKQDIPESIRLTGKAHMVTAIQGNDVILHCDANTKVERIENAYWQMMPYCESFRWTTSDLGACFYISKR